MEPRELRARLQQQVDVGDTLQKLVRDLSSFNEHDTLKTQVEHWHRTNKLLLEGFDSEKCLKEYQTMRLHARRALRHDSLPDFRESLMQTVDERTQGLKAVLTRLDHYEQRTVGEDPTRSRRTTSPASSSVQTLNNSWWNSVRTWGDHSSRHNAYFDEVTGDGPFCPKCYDGSKHLAMRMQKSPWTVPTCPECGTFAHPDSSGNEPGAYLGTASPLLEEPD